MSEVDPQTLQGAVEHLRALGWEIVATKKNGAVWPWRVRRPGRKVFQTAFNFWIMDWARAAGYSPVGEDAGA